MISLLFYFSLFIFFSFRFCVARVIPEIVKMDRQKREKSKDKEENELEILRERITRLLFFGVFALVLSSCSVFIILHFNVFLLPTFVCNRAPHRETVKQFLLSSFSLWRRHRRYAVYFFPRTVFFSLVRKKKFIFSVVFVAFDEFLKRWKYFERQVQGKDARLRKRRFINILIFTRK